MPKISFPIEAKDKASANIKKVDRAIEDLGDSFKDLGREADSAERSASKLTDAFNATTAGTAALTAGVLTAVEAVTSFVGGIIEATEEQKEFQRTIQLGSNMLGINARHLERNARALKTYGIEAESYIDVLREFEIRKREALREGPGNERFDLFKEVAGDIDIATLSLERMIGLINQFEKSSRAFLLDELVGGDELVAEAMRSGDFKATLQAQLVWDDQTREDFLKASRSFDTSVENFKASVAALGTTVLKVATEGTDFVGVVGNYLQQYWEIGKRQYTDDFNKIFRRLFGDRPTPPQADEETVIRPGDFDTGGTGTGSSSGERVVKSIQELENEYVKIANRQLQAEQKQYEALVEAIESTSGDVQGRLQSMLEQNAVYIAKQAQEAAEQAQRDQERDDAMTKHFQFLGTTIDKAVKESGVTGVPDLRTANQETLSKLWEDFRARQLVPTNELLIEELARGLNDIFKEAAANPNLRALGTVDESDALARRYQQLTGLQGSDFWDALTKARNRLTKEDEQLAAQYQQTEALYMSSDALSIIQSELSGWLPQIAHNTLSAATAALQYAAAPGPLGLLTLGLQSVKLLHSLVTDGVKTRQPFAPDPTGRQATKALGYTLGRQTDFGLPPSRGEEGPTLTLDIDPARIELEDVFNLLPGLRGEFNDLEQAINRAWQTSIRGGRTSEEALELFNDYMTNIFSKSWNDFQEQATNAWETNREGLGLTDKQMRALDAYMAGPFKASVENMQQRFTAAWDDIYESEDPVHVKIRDLEILVRDEFPRAIRTLRNDWVASFAVVLRASDAFFTEEERKNLKWVKELEDGTQELKDINAALEHLQRPGFEPFKGLISSSEGWNTELFRANNFLVALGGNLNFFDGREFRAKVVTEHVTIGTPSGYVHAYAGAAAAQGSNEDIAAARRAAAAAEEARRQAALEEARRQAALRPPPPPPVVNTPTPEQLANPGSGSTHRNLYEEFHRRTGDPSAASLNVGTVIIEGSNLTKDEIVDVIKEKSAEGVDVIDNRGIYDVRSGF